jgi:hypothetical protein
MIERGGAGERLVSQYGVRRGFAAGSPAEGRRILRGSAGVVLLALMSGWPMILAPTAVSVGATSNSTGSYPSYPFLSSVSALSPTGAWAVGDKTNGDYNGVVLHWNGST